MNSGREPAGETKRGERLLCIHGHFYQPPRENPWTGRIERQPGAQPYHDWNEKITAECYTPNAEARLPGEDERIVNNYQKISFNFGPTLLRWLETEAPETYQAILDADHSSQALYSGHGSALAQAYHHSILPLCNARDKFTEVFWGLRDFEYRFGRSPEGMWLAETAADLESLEVLHANGVRYTILSPLQAARVRPAGSREWVDVSDGSIDTRKGYRLELPSGAEISLFFYDKSISKAVAFERLLQSGELFSNRLLRGFSDSATNPELVHIATDGETYGHHHKFGEMALAYTLSFIEENRLARITVYGQFLEQFPPEDVVEIQDRTSWSCPHGVERWRSDCGCQTGGEAGWNQEWRGPLRDALNWLRDQLAPPFEKELANFVEDPWQARNEYIEVVMDPSDESVQSFLRKHRRRPLETGERSRVIKLLEQQRNALMMFTSCGWFFNDVAGIETVQILSYARRAIELSEELFARDWEAGFLLRLAKAQSNQREEGDASDIYRKHVLGLRQRTGQ